MLMDLTMGKKMRNENVLVSPARQIKVEVARLLE